MKITKRLQNNKEYKQLKLLHTHESMNIILKLSE